MDQRSKALGRFGIAMIVAVVLNACGGGGGGGTPGSGGSGSVPTGNPSVVAKISSPAPLAQCPTGGITVETGIDSNLNGLLDPSEVDVTQYVCNGAPALVSIVSEPSGTLCPNGGSLVSSGSDSNGNGVLDAGEVTSTDSICSGPTGSAGSNGANSLLSVTNEPVGGNCPTGGLKVVSWLDTTANGSLDAGETSFTNYLCRTPGTVVIQSISADPAVVRPGADTSLKVSATDGVGSPLTYQWSGSGTFALAGSETTAWTAPSTVGSYLLSVVVSNGSSTVTGYASVLVSAAPAGPIVTNVSPQAVRAGSDVVITGAGFGASQGTSTVSIGGAFASTISSWSEYEIKAVVPAGAVTGSVVVTVGGVAGSPGSVVVPWAAGITTEANAQTAPQAVADGAGGAIIIWLDGRNGGTDIYAQRVNSTGAPLWSANGVAIGTGTGSRYSPRLVSDGAGGAIIAWDDGRNGVDIDIYAQRVNSAGTVLWTSNGLPVAAVSGSQISPQLVADGSGGAIIVWQDMRGAAYNIYAQRLSGNGAEQWTAGGVALTSGAGTKYGPQIATDGAGGAIIAWQDNRVNPGNYDIYAQRINGSGAQLWTANGVAIAVTGGDQVGPQLVSDGAAGAIITWMDFRYGSAYHTYAQRVNDQGVQWAVNGIAVSSGGSEQLPQLVPDGAGGAIITWFDGRNGAYDLFAQRVSSTGAVLWAADMPVCSAPSTQYLPRMIPDGGGGAIVAWEDYRSGTSSDIYAARVSGAGSFYWTAMGIAVSTAAGDETNTQLVSDGAGGAIIIWQDTRSGNADIYGQSIGFDGVL